MAPPAGKGACISDGLLAVLGVDARAVTLLASPPCSQSSLKPDTTCY